MNELYDLVGALRDGDPRRDRTVEAVGALVEEFQAAGAPVTLRRTGTPATLSTLVSQAAYRVWVRPVGGFGPDGPASLEVLDGGQSAGRVVVVGVGSGDPGGGWPPDRGQAATCRADGAGVGRRA